MGEPPKRKSDKVDDLGNKRAKTEEEVDEEGLTGLSFSAFTIHLHPAALGKTRRAIFENQIESHGGHLAAGIDVRSDSGRKLLVLLESSTVAVEKLRPIVEKCLEEIQRRKLDGAQVVGISWLSKCIEQKTLLDTDSFRLDKRILARMAKKAAKSSDDSGDAESNNKEEDEGDGGEDSKNKDSAAATTSSTLATASVTAIGSYIDRNKHKFVCAQSSENPTSTNLNKHITDELEKLAAAYKSTRDTWRAFGYQKAISAIKNFPREIKNRREAAQIPNVGEKMAEKIAEIIEDGSLRKVAEVCDSDKMRVLDLFNRVWGAGPSTAEQWYQKGLRTLKDVEERGNPTKNQKVGLKYFEDLDERMDRSECTEILEVVTKAGAELQEGLEIVGCGSYRRGKATCGDLDILVTHKDDTVLEGLFEKLLSKLRSSGFLTDDLTIHRDGRQQKYLGVCKLPGESAKHRRLDIIVVPPDERACALMYFTGSAHFNRSMRLLATKMGMSLSEHSLVTNVVRHKREKMNEGVALDTPTEESVFEHLGLPYRAPHERNH